MDESTILDSINSELGLKTKAAREFLRLALEGVTLMDRKQQDYGSKNISKFGTFGVLVRLSDKIERLKNLRGLKPGVKAAIVKFKSNLRRIERHELEMSTLDQINMLDDCLTDLSNYFNKRRKRTVNENILDTFRDISNYAIIALMLEAKLWPDE